MFSTAGPAARRRPCLRRPCVPRQRDGRTDRGGRARARTGGDGDERSHLDAQSLSRHVRAGAGDPGAACGRARTSRSAGATVATVRAVAAPGADIVCAGADTAPQTWDAEGRRRLRLLSRVGLVDPRSIDDYRALGGYAALRRAVELGPDATIREVADAKLLGRGGAAFPAGAKWKAVAEQAGAPPLRRVQRRRVRAGHLQGPAS